MVPSIGKNSSNTIAVIKRFQVPAFVAGTFFNSVQYFGVLIRIVTKGSSGSVLIPVVSVCGAAGTLGRRTARSCTADLPQFLRNTHK